MAQLKLDIPPEHWRAVLPFLHHHIGHMDPSPLEPDPRRVLKHLEESIRSQFTEEAIHCYIDDDEVDCTVLKE